MPSLGDSCRPRVHHVGLFVEHCQGIAELFCWYCQVGWFFLEFLILISNPQGRESQRLSHHLFSIFESKWREDFLLWMFGISRKVFKTWRESISSFFPPPDVATSNHCSDSHPSPLHLNPNGGRNSYFDAWHLQMGTQSLTGIHSQSFFPPLDVAT